jgi:transcriptional regulator with XRE-family HTH domain
MKASPRIALRKYMKENRLTREALAQRLGVSRPAISLLLSDEQRAPSLGLAFAIERVTGGRVPAEAWTSSPARRRA